MVPSSVNVGYWILAVDPKSDEIIFPGSGQAGLKSVESFDASTLCNKAWHSVRVTATLQEFAKACTAPNVESLRITPSFQVDSAAHQRVPPNCPWVQSCPSR